MSKASCHLGRCRWSAGTWALRRRSASPSQLSGRNSRQSSGQEAWSVAAWIDTPTWQLATLPSAPQYWVATELGEGSVVDDPRGRLDGRGHALSESAAHRRRVPRALVDKLLQRLLQRIGVGGGVATGQPGGHGLDRLALAVQQQPAQVGLAPAALVFAGDGCEQVLGECGQTGADTAKLCRCHGVPPAAVAHSLSAQGISLHRYTQQQHFRKT